MFLGGSQDNPWSSARIGHLESGQKHPDFRPKQNPRKKELEPLEGVVGYEQWLEGKTVVADDQPWGW